MGMNQSLSEINTASPIPEELVNSTEKILRYSGIARERAELFKANLETYRKMSRKPVLENDLRRIKETLSLDFFEIYDAVFKRVLLERNQSRLYRMFLKFCYMDEGLLEPEQVITLYRMLDKTETSGRYPVFGFDGWLEEIYHQRKAPSVDQFGQDYYDLFRDMKKRGILTERDRVAYENDVNAKLRHENQNLFRMGQRICSGQMREYFPILHSGMIIGDLERALVTPAKIAASLDRILEIDFSAFHRELVYSNPEKGIQKEMIMKPVLPDFILLPTFGSRVIMWQELTGRDRNSPGRFVLPLFTNENIDNLMVELVARFRWELSRTMNSTTRNEGPGSLYTDYMDYIQYYKKNIELSSEVKGKIKILVDKYRNNYCGIFAADYQAWINYESKGLIRSNKVARSILFKNCPFSKPIRDGLERQPLFSQSISRYNNFAAKQYKIIEAHYRRLFKPGVPIDQEMVENLMYYRM